MSGGPGHDARQLADRCTLNEAQTQQYVTMCVPDVISVDSEKQKASVLQHEEQVSELSLHLHVSRQQEETLELTLTPYNVVGHMIAPVDTECAWSVLLHSLVLFQLHRLVGF